MKLSAQRMSGQLFKSSKISEMSIEIDKVFCFPDTLVRYAQMFWDLHESDESPSPQIEMFNSNTTLVAAQMHGVEKLKDI